MRWRFFPSPRCLISYVESWIFPGALRGMGHSDAYDPFHYGYGWNQNCVDLSGYSSAQKPVHLVYFLSGLLVHYHCAAGGLCFVFVRRTVHGQLKRYRESGVMERKKRNL